MKEVVVGKIVNTCGLKGEVKVINYSDFVDQRYQKNNVLFASKEGENNKSTLTVSSFRKNDKFIYLKFKEINTIEEAENLKECYLLIDGSKLEKINEDTFYHYELLNMEVFFEDKKIGLISEVSDNGAQDLIRIKGDDINILVPFVDDFIEKINIEENRIVLKNIGGLL